jgi:hypothetical protein
VLPPPRSRQRSAASADEYALSTKDYLTGLITAEEKYEKDFRIPDTRRLHSDRRDRLRLCEKPGRRFDGQDDDERQEKEQEETQTSPFSHERDDSKRGDSEEEIETAFFL